jgi:hypothetical protein
MFSIFYRKQKHLIAVLSILFALPLAAKQDGGLILSGLDTLYNDIHNFGFDFVLQRPCTSSTDNQCNTHFTFGWGSTRFNDSFVAWLLGQGLVLDLGKLNLDSIKSAPPDSVMKADLGLGQPYMIFKIAPDSLSKCVGNVYILKTATDPRPIWNLPFYAKIRILKFIVVDSASHQIKMVFLWAFNRSGFKDLTTSGLDTFHLDPTIAARNSFRPAPLAHGNKNFVFKVIGDGFVLPPGLAGKSVVLSVYDLSGKKLGQLSVNNEKVVSLRQFIKNRGVAVVKVER